MAEAAEHYGPTAIDERFDAGRLDEHVWTPAYLPAWSSARDAAATYTVGSDGLRLTIPPDQQLWCPDQHDGRLRVSAVQSGNWSGPVGSTQGQQPFRDGLRVREAQPTRWGYTPLYGTIEVVCRARLSARSMFSAWLVGLEDRPERCGEICLVEVFGDTITVGDDGRPRAALGCGVHAFRDPRLQEDFSAVSHPVDVGSDHRYAVNWQRGSIDFTVDGTVLRTLRQAPDYPMQLIIGIFDFPDRAGAREILPTPVPELTVSRVRGTPAHT